MFMRYQVARDLVKTEASSWLLGGHEKAEVSSRSAVAKYSRRKQDSDPHVVVAGDGKGSFDTYSIVKSAYFSPAVAECK
jgi:hypothetical protein